MKKKFVFTGDWVGDQCVGMQRFSMEIIKRIDELIKPTDGIILIMLLPCDIDFDYKFKNIRIEKRGTIKKKFGKIIWQQLTYTKYVRKEKAIGIDLTTEMPLMCKCIYAIHDCIPVMFPQNYRNNKKFLFIWKLKTKIISLKRSSKIITVSETSKNDLINILKIDRTRIEVIYNGWEHIVDIEPDFAILDREKLKNKKYFLSIGTNYYHKNYAWIAKTAEKNKQYDFVLVGSKKYYDSAFDGENIKKLCYLDDAELKALLLKSEALIMPSFYEGFGIPPLEALALGKRIIISNTGSLPEIYETTAYYIDPKQPCDDIDFLLQSKVENATNILEKYTWKNAAKKMVRLLTNYGT